MSVKINDIAAQAGVFFTSCMVRGADPVAEASNVRLENGARTAAFRRYVRISTERAAAERRRSDAALSAHIDRLAALPKALGYAVERGHFGARGRGGWRVYLDPSNLRSGHRVVYSRDLPAGAGAEDAVRAVLQA